MLEWPRSQQSALAHLASMIACLSNGTRDDVQLSLYAIQNGIEMKNSATTTSGCERAKHVVLLPYFSQEEVSRYLMIADWLERAGCHSDSVHYVLAASPRIESSEKMLAAFERLGPATHFRCPTQIFGYPEGPTAMFWDCMDHVAERFSGNGFALWLESDMAFVQSNWVDRLESDWFAGDATPLLMGCYVPEVYKFRWLRRKKKVLDPHINGGACYALDFARHMPREARDGVFDMVVFEHARRLGRVRETRQIAFSTMERVRRDVIGGQASILHGFMQDKDPFIRRCLAPISRREMQTRFLHPFHDRLELFRRRVSVCFFRRGRKAVLESMLLAKQQLQN